VEQLFADYERGLRGPEAKRQAVDQIVRELSVHVAIEEAYFYLEGLTVQMNATGCPAWNSVSYWATSVWQITSPPSGAAVPSRHPLSGRSMPTASCSRRSRPATPSSTSSDHT
jgi:hypothetical protein